jgi:hypothetical protein
MSLWRVLSRGGNISNSWRLGRLVWCLLVCQLVSRLVRCSLTGGGATGDKRFIRRRANTDNSIVFCDHDIVQYIYNVSLNDAAGRNLPYGRTFLAVHHAQALYYYDSDVLRNQFRIRSCYWTKNHTLTFTKHRSHHLCTEMTLHSLLIGPEVASPLFTDVKIIHETSEFPICEWNVAFSPRLATGDYELIVWTHAMNEFREPTTEERARAKDDRHNVGESISLSGLGMVDYFDIHPFETLDFTGRVVRYSDSNPPFSFLMMNQSTMRRFQTDPHDWGFDSDKILRCSHGFFRHVTEIFPSLNASNIKQFIASLPVPSASAVQVNAHLPGLMDIIHLLFRNAAFNESQVFRLPGPGNVHIVNPSSQHVRWNHLCRSRSAHTSENGTAASNLISSGRWVFVKECEVHYEYGASDEFQLYHYRLAWGDRCSQSHPIESERMPHLLRGYVWMPWDCNLLEMDARKLYLQPGTESTVTASLFREIVDWIEAETTANSSFIRFTTAAAEYTHGKLVPGSGPAGTPRDLTPRMPSLGTPLGFCLKAKGIGMIAGFGDSLGQEQWSNFQFLLGAHSLNTWTDEKHTISCTGSSSYPIHAIDHAKELADCIERETTALMNNDTMKVMSLVDDYPTQANTAVKVLKVPVTTVVLITNFMVQHAVSSPLAVCEQHLAEIGRIHSELATKLYDNYKIKYRRIYMSGVSIHGFKLTGLTNARQEWFNRKARELLTDFEIWDVFNITLSRPDASVDGTHYPEGVSQALTDTLVNKLCVER